MRTFVLLSDHMGFPEGTKLQGPIEIPNSGGKQGYYRETDIENPTSKFCLYDSYVHGNPDIFKEIPPAQEPGATNQ